jgi:microcystin-dependent protein
MHFGQGGGLSVQVLGAKGGTESEVLTLAQLPSHTHGAATIPASSQPATKTDPAGCVFAVPNNGGFAYQTAANASLGGGVSLSVGSNQPHSNLQPYLCLNFIIALQGIFPSRN